MVHEIQLKNIKVLYNTFNENLNAPYMVFIPSQVCGDDSDHRAPLLSVFHFSLDFSGKMINLKLKCGYSTTVDIDL